MTKWAYERHTIIHRDFDCFYVLYWSAVGLVVYLVTQIINDSIGDPSLVGTRLIQGASFALLPIINIWQSHEFPHAVTEMNECLDWSDSDVEQWLEKQNRRIFAHRTRESASVAAFIVATGLYTVLSLPMPFRHSLANWIGCITFVGTLYLCGHCLSVSIGLIAALRQILDVPTKAPISMMMARHSVSRLQSFYSKSALAITVLYILLLTGIWQGPYGRPNGIYNPLMLIWLAALALYPLAMFVLSFYYSHIILLKIKFSHLEIVNSELRLAIEGLQQYHNQEQASRVETLLTVDNQVGGVSEWPAAPGGAVTFTITMVTALSQIFVSVSRILKP